jgi:hypothetical protein
MRTIWTLGDAVRRFPLMRVDCPCGNLGFFNTMEVAGKVGYERDPHKVPFRCRECGGQKGNPKVQLLELDVDRLPKAGVWRPMKMGRNQPTGWTLQRLR